MATKNKTAKKKATKAAVKRMAGLIGYDARNGKVQMLDEKKGKVKGYEITNERTGYKAFEATRTAALALYNAQINNSHRQ
jgi:hypothetical protein